MKKKFCLAKNVVSSNFKRSPSPYKLTFSITNRCNSRCKTCNIWKKDSESELSLQELKKFFDNTTNISWLDITGGEIFLREDIEEIFEVINKKCENLYLLHFPTNGILTDKIIDISKKINDYDIPEFIVSVSLDGPKEVHDKIRGVEGAFEKAINTYNGLREAGVEVYFGMTLSQYNVGKLRKTLRVLESKAKGFEKEQIHISLYHQSDHYYSNQDIDLKQLRQDIELVRRLKGSSLDPVQYLEQRFLEGAIEYIREGKMPVKCKALQASCFIDPKGQVYPCTIYDKKVGSLRENKYELKKIWNSEKAKEALSGVKDLECDGCWTACEIYQSILGDVSYFTDLK